MVICGGMVAREQRRLAAIVCADVVGYSRLIGADEAGTLVRLRALRQELVDPNLAAHGGRLVKTTGDGLLVEFGSVVDAARCAVAVQQEMAKRDENVPPDRRIAFRVGIHMGDIVIDGDDILGDGVNVAARLEALAEPGGVCVSGRVQEDLVGKFDLDLRDDGEQALKNIARPVRVWRWSPDHREAERASPADAPLTLPDKPSIAVLPFANMSGDPEQEYFTDGISEDIITELSRFRDLFVIARNSSFSYKGNSPNIRQVGRELGVRYVVEGSIRRAANRVRVTAQLIDSITGSHVWAERYDRALDDIFALQEEVTRAIVSAIAPEIRSSEETRATRRPPDALGAYELALRAWAHAMEAYAKADGSLFDCAIAEGEAALRIDPNSVKALHTLTMAHGMGCYTRRVADPAGSLRIAIEAASRAVELDGADARSYALRGFCAFWGRQYDRYADGLADVRRAHEMNPNDTTILQLLANLEATIGDPERAIEIGRAILRLNPRDSHSHTIYVLLAFSCAAASRYAEGVEWALRARHDRPRMVQPWTNLVICLVGVGEIDKARVALEELRAVAPDAVDRLLTGEQSPDSRPKNRDRQRVFARIAAGLEDPSAAEAFR